MRPRYIAVVEPVLFRELKQQRAQMIIGCAFHAVRYTRRIGRIAHLSLRVSRK